ncbi:MAG: ABC transporter permease [Christensenellales bacterium]|jgi:inositol transport system permease protein|nr:ABC transporter permease [Christensenellaceae bacterium]
MSTRQLSNRKVSFTEIYSKFGIVLVMIAFIIIFSLMSPVFLSKINILNVLTQASVVTIIGCGITLLIITGNTDLSAGSMVALSGCVALGTFKNLTQNNMWGDVPAGIVAVIVSVLVCIAMYGSAGLIITKLHTPAFIVTLGISTAARGLALMYTKGRVIKNIGNIVKIGQGRFLGEIPYPILFMILFVIITWFLLGRTRFGRYIYAVGGNSEAAKAAGINTDNVVLKCYLFHAICVGIAGVLFMARLNSAQPSEGVGLEFDAITGAIIGGASLAGGLGSASGTVVGCMVIAMIANILTLKGVLSYYQQIITGIIIVLAVVIDVLTKGAKRN